jgi:hypothetical protein
MHRASSTFQPLSCAVALIVAMLAVLPGSAVAAQSSANTNSGTTIFLPMVFNPDPPAPPQTPQQIKYGQLHTELYGLDALLSQAAGYRQAYANFVYNEQLVHHDTALLDGGPANFDSYLDLATKARQAGIVAISGNPGLDAQGNLTDGTAYDTAMKQGADADWTVRSYLNLAMSELHSDLTLYHQVWGYAVPDIPKWNLTPFSFSY